MGGAVHHTGGPGSGAVVKLMINTLFATQVAVLAELLALVRQAGVDPGRAMQVLGQTPVASPAACGAGAAMLARAFAPAFPIDLVVKDLALARAAGKEMPVTARVAEVFATAAELGFGGDNITGVAQLWATGT